MLTLGWHRWLTCAPRRSQPRAVMGMGDAAAADTAFSAAAAAFNCHRGKDARQRNACQSSCQERLDSVRKLDLVARLNAWKAFNSPCHATCPVIFYFLH